MRASLLLCVGLAGVLPLAGCAKPAINRIQYLRPGVALPAQQYKPAKDAILILNGGFGSAKPADPLVTRWRRKKTGETFFLTLMPNAADVQALVPGTYELVSATGFNQEVIGAQGDREISASRVSNVTLSAGDVIYAGRILVTPQNAGNKPVDLSKAKWKIEIGNDSSIAVSGLQAKFPRQASRLRINLLKLAKK